MVRVMYVTLLNSKAHFMTIDPSICLDGRERKKENTLVAYQPLSSQLRVGRDVAAVVFAAIVVVEVEEVEEKLRLNDSPDCDSIYLKFSI